MINAGALMGARRLSDFVAWAGISCLGYAALLPAGGCWVAGLPGCHGVFRWPTMEFVRGDQALHLGGGPVLEFRVLGPVQAVRDGRELALGGLRRRAVLALLLVAGGRVVPAEQLAEDLWGGCPPPGAAGTLRSHVSRLRALVGSDAALVARGGGYALEVPPDQLDASRFGRLAGAGREALEAGEAAAA